MFDLDIKKEQWTNKILKKQKTVQVQPSLVKIQNPAHLPQFPNQPLQIHPDGRLVQTTTGSPVILGAPGQPGQNFVGISYI